MLKFDYVRNEIELMRVHVHRQRHEIYQLQREGIPTASAEDLLDRMLKRVDEMSAERARLKNVQPAHEDQVEQTTKHSDAPARSSFVLFAEKS